MPLDYWGTCSCGTDSVSSKNLLPRFLALRGESFPCNFGFGQHSVTVHHALVWQPRGLSTPCSVVMVGFIHVGYYGGS